eukprot:TRINITY_DN10936_c0_g2_i1.p1 TRINITY_DN10936_c0_g2~~TRINITY_DN10936_c0_g2_i1.p1  ORF type:complete len:465 (-),score=69.48 TRINITY_DN10936_c0_g2_i1:74-1468(-)
MVSRYDKLRGKVSPRPEGDVYTPPLHWPEDTWVDLGQRQKWLPQGWGQGFKITKPDRRGVQLGGNATTVFVSPPIQGQATRFVYHKQKVAQILGVKTLPVLPESVWENKNGCGRELSPGIAPFVPGAWPTWLPHDWSIGKCKYPRTHPGFQRVFVHPDGERFWYHQPEARKAVAGQSLPGSKVNQYQFEGELMRYPALHDEDDESQEDYDSTDEYQEDGGAVSRGSRRNEPVHVELIDTDSETECEEIDMPDGLPIVLERWLRDFFARTTQEVCTLFPGEEICGANDGALSYDDAKVLVPKLQARILAQKQQNDEDGLDSSGTNLERMGTKLRELQKSLRRAGPQYKTTPYTRGQPPLEDAVINHIKSYLINKHSFLKHLGKEDARAPRYGETPWLLHGLCQSGKTQGMLACAWLASFVYDCVAFVYIMNSGGVEYRPQLQQAIHRFNSDVQTAISILVPEKEE